ncbi:MAG TPA: aminopeptidase P family N-terminal domain-containing protein, partial [bacterium]|nr:aminopeptidase P family N-terminal domain-containing protein [bacterium]
MIKYEARQERFRRWMGREHFDGFLITNLTNVRYLCGFTGSNGTILMTQEEGIFLTDGRYRFQAADEVQGLPVKFAVGKSLPRQLKPLIPARIPFRLGFESDVVTVVQHGFLLQELRS